MSKNDKPPESSETVEEVPEPQPPGLPFNLETVDPKKLEQADALLAGTGFSIRKLANWANGVELRLQGIAENLTPNVQRAVETSLRKLQTEAMQRQREYLQQNPQAAAGGGQGGLGGLMQLLPYLSGGGQDEEIAKLTKDMMRMSIDRMKGDMDFTTAIKDAVVKKIVGKAASDIVG